MTRSRKEVLLGLVILLATLLAYLPAMQARFIWDDDAYVTENPVLQSTDGLRKIWLEPRSTPQYYPLVFTSFWIEYRLWGVNPAGYHIVNILLHALSAILLWRVLLKLDVPWPFFAAMIFALHPVHVESVAWVTERKNVLSGIFFLGSGFCLVRYFGLGMQDREQGNWPLYSWGLFLFICALLSKTVTCSLPAVVALLLWWKRGRISGREWLLLSPLFALGLVSGLMTAWLERAHVGAEGLEWTYTFLERCLIAGRILWFYIGKLIWPADLSFNYPRWEIDAGIWWQYLYPAGVLAAVGLLWQFSGKLGRGPITALLCFCGVLFPALGFIDVYPFRYSFVADHFQYHASIGLIVLGTAASAHLFAHVPQREINGIRPLFSSAALLLLVCLTFAQAGIYRNLETLWEHTLKKNPTSWLAHNNLGNLQLNRGDIEGALEHHKKALSLRPDKEVSLTNLGHAMATAGKMLEAETYYLEAIRTNPKHAEAYYNLGVLRMRQNKMEDAVRQFMKVLQIRPDHAESHTNLSLVLAQQGKKEEALGHLRAAVAFRPDLAEARMALGRLLAARGDMREAAEHFSAALNIKPDRAEAHLHLGLVLGLQGRFEESVIHLEEAVRLKPDSAEARMRLSQTLWLAGKKEAANRELEALKGLDQARAGELKEWMASRP